MKYPFDAKRKALPGVDRAVEFCFTEDGIEYRYTVYVPESFRPGMPLVIELHGGSASGNYQTRSTAWAALAEQNGFVVLYPSANYYTNPEARRPDWRCKTAEYEADCDYIKHIADKVIGEYKIDIGRVYMSGFSIGDNMAQVFASRYGCMLAGLAGFCGPTAAELLDERVFPGVPVPIIQIRGEDDLSMPVPALNRLPPEQIRPLKYQIDAENLELWIRKNAASAIPIIKNTDKINSLLYISSANNCDVHYIEVCGMGHEEPMFGMQYVWENCFKRYRRAGDRIERIIPSSTGTQENVFVIAEGYQKAYKNGCIIDLKYIPETASADVPDNYWRKMSEHDERMIPSLFMSAEDLAVLTDSCLVGDVLIKDGNRYVFYINTGLVIEETVEGEVIHLSSGRQAVEHNGVLYLPVYDVLRMMDLWPAEEEGVLYCSEEYSRLSSGAAIIIRDLLMTG